MEINNESVEVSELLAIEEVWSDARAGESQPARRSKKRLVHRYFHLC